MKSSVIDSLLALNEATENEAQAWFMQTCTSERWCRKMVKQRPFANLEALNSQANLQWQTMTSPDYIEAFSGHPMIGDINTLRKKYANTKALASNEQSGTQGASEETLHKLQQMNKAYLDKHGFIFIICATGLSADAMLNKLEKRLPNSTESEMENAAQEQMKITLLRINKAFGGASA
jgi:2-oxo-4-hydroxy-4-carboxy-5-ureidoimidazoline decarboxylase